MENLVTVENLGFWYDKKTIFQNISFNLKRGAFYSLIGPSGSGKSTLLYILGALLKPKQGKYFFEGKQVYRLGEFGLGSFRKKNIGFLFQDFRLLPFLTVEKNVEFPILFTGKKINREEKRELLQSLGIYHRRKAYPKDISGGEAQRCALGRALVLKPKLLLLDEPTGNLDINTEREILQLLLGLKKQNITLFCVTHSQAIIKKSDEVFKIYEGHFEILK